MASPIKLLFPLLSSHLETAGLAIPRSTVRPFTFEGLYRPTTYLAKTRALLKKTSGSDLLRSVRI